VDSLADIQAAVNPAEVTSDAVESSLIRCPDSTASREMEARLKEVRKQRDTIGGVIGCAATGLPAGWGSPVFDKIEADLAKGMMSLPAAKGIEVGSGFAGTLLPGSQHNDAFVMDGDRVRTETNHSGGIQGGITNGEPIRVRVAFKAVATHFQSQKTVTSDGESVEFAAKGRHDPCVLPRAVPIVEAMMCLVLCDHMLRTATLLR
jgi:chorismate synthase